MKIEENLHRQIAFGSEKKEQGKKLLRRDLRVVKVGSSYVLSSARSR
jgi:hypothetical protein